MMVRGILIGLFWGGVVSVVGLGVASLINDPPSLEPVALAQDDRSTTIVPSESGASTEGMTVDSDIDVPDVAAVNETALSNGAETVSETVTEGSIDPNPDTPPVLTVDTESAEDTTPQVVAEDATSEAAHSDPAENGSDDEGTDTAGSVPSQPAPSPETSDVAMAALGDPEVEEGGNAENAQETGEAMADVTSVPEEDAAKQETEEAVQDTDKAQEAETQPAVPSLIPSQDPMTETSQEIIVLLEEPDVAEPNGPKPRIANLPTVGGAGAASTFETQTGPKTVGQTIIPDRAVSEDAGSAWTLNHTADPVDTNGKPLFSIILVIDEPTQPGPETMVAFPYPVSFAVSLDLPEAQRTIQLIRDLGYEAYAIPSLPQEATVADVATSFELQKPQDLEVVGLLESQIGWLQSDRDVTKQVIDFAKANGLGLVYQSRGLNAALAQARKAGVPSAEVFRDIGQVGAGSDQIRRGLDQAVLRSADGRNVVVMGKLEANTVSGLLLWGLQDRASRVALVPASQIILDEQPQ